MLLILLYISFHIITRKLMEVYNRKLIEYNAESPSRSSPESSLGSLESEIEESVRRWLFRRMEAGDLTSDGDLEAGDLDGLIKRFLHLKEVRSPGVPDLDGSFQEDDLFKQTQQNTSASDYQWFNDELGFGTFGENETGSPLCIGINTDYDLASIDMDVPFKLGGADGDIQLESRGERIASITGSIMEQLAEFEDSVSGQESTDMNNSMEMSICKSGNLFSPLADNQPEIPVLSTFSTDSLDVRSDILATCAATNHNNYTIAFNGNNILEESCNTTSSAYRTATATTPTTSDKVNENDHRRLTHWIKQCPTSDKNQKRISNNNGSSNDSSSQFTVDNTSHLLTQSCPNAKVTLTNKRRIFDIGIRRRNYYQREGSITESSELVIGSDGSHGTSSGGSSIPMSSDESVNNLHHHRHHTKSRLEKARPTTTAEIAEIIKKSIQIQTSVHTKCQLGKSVKDGSSSVPVYVCYPNYTLPDLNFLSERKPETSKKDVYLIPQQYKVPLREKRVNTPGYRRTRRPMSCNDIEELKANDLSHIRDWPSLNFLLPDEYRKILKDMKPKFEENNEDEKSREAGLGLDENHSPVVTRKKSDPEKRYSLNMESGQKASRRFNTKRFSLQEPIIPEINEITNEINKNLRVLNEMESEIAGNNTQTEVGVSYVIENGFPVPQNTPRMSFIDSSEGKGNGMTMRTIQNSVTRMSKMIIPNLTEKQSLADAVKLGVAQIQPVCKPKGLGRGQSGSSNLIIISKSAAGKFVLESLCPALYSLLSDGLCPFLDTIFGKIPNTVWRVIEASIQYGPTAQTLNELVMKINSEESLAEGPMKFNAFICGLLNLGNLSSWLLFLRTKERLLRTHYDPAGLMFLCNTSTRAIYDQMVEAVNFLTKLPFQLDIFHEVKVLHQSISTSNKAMKTIRHGSSGSRSNSASAARKHSQIDSNKLSHEQQGKAYASSKNSKYYVNQLKKTQMKRSFSDERPNPSKVQIGSSIPKSKTSQNINTEKYASAPKLSSKLSAKGIRAPNIDYEPHLRVLRLKDQEKGIEPSRKAPRPKSLGNPNQLLQTDEFLKENGGGEKDPEKFRNLRMQWELMTSDEVKGRPISLASPVNGPSNFGSKIPRPISSPVKTQNHFPNPNFKNSKR